MIPPRGAVLTRATQPGAGGTVDARKSVGKGQNAGFSYTVLSESRGGAEPGERRTFTRQRTKLRSGKIIHANGQFITECLIHNRSASGCRLRLAAAIALPSLIHLFDDQSERLFQAAVMWQRQRDVGIRLLPSPANGRNRAIAQRMKGKFYALDR